MMGVQQPPQSSLFYVGFNLDQRVRQDHPLRRVNELIDFNFVYEEVKDLYGIKGNVSVAPPVILKLMLLLIFYNVRSERELMQTLPERLDWLWFLGLDLDSDIPNHSVLSKARKKWGVEVFYRFFTRVLTQCIEVGLVDGGKVFMDASLIDADASKDSIMDSKNLKHQMDQKFKILEARLTEKQDSADSEKTNHRYISTTDPDAAIVKRGDSRLRYQTHRAVDSKNEIITAVEVTPGDVNEAHVMADLMDQHEANTATEIQTVVADSKYGTVENYLACHDRQINAHIPDLGQVAAKRIANRGIFLEDQFLYDPANDLYICPAGSQLTPKSFHRDLQTIVYRGSRKTCKCCSYRQQCTKNKTGRTITRHLRQSELDQMRRKSRSVKAKRDLKTRQHLMERSFARSTKFSFDRARWRKLWRVKIQEYLVCTIQNIQVLISCMLKPERGSVALKATVPKSHRVNPSSLLPSFWAELTGWLDLWLRIKFSKSLVHPV